MQASPRQSTPVAGTCLSWCSAAQPLSGRLARPALAGRDPERLLALRGVDALQSHLDLFVLPWLAASGCQGVTVEDADNQADEG